MIPAITLNRHFNNNMYTQRKAGVFRGVPPCTREISGTQTKAKIFTDNVNYQTLEQIKKICSHPVFKDIPIRIMPDTHAGINSVVGFTAPLNPQCAVIPSIISGDIGCGMLCVKFDSQGADIDYKKLDEVIRSTLVTSRKNKPKNYNTQLNTIERPLDNLYHNKYKSSSGEALNSLGTLGGGNHFIEIDKDTSGNNYLIIHTGSRKFGKDVYSYYQNIANRQNPYRIQDWSYLTGDEAKSYLEDMRIAIKFADLNRRIIANEILSKMGWKELESFESIHNYISEDGIIRKGAVSAMSDEKVLIPLNMRDGAVIAHGRGNPDWNYSAPHGAGRQFSRSEAAQLINIDDYKDTMKGIYSSCISPSTINESPFAYKDSGTIIDNIEDTVNIEQIIKPKYNFKD